MERVDAVVVGAGFGGLGAALQLAEAGLRVVVCETLSYAGGTGGTFSHRGRRFNAGATLAMGLEPGGAFDRVLARHGVRLAVEPLCPAVEVRTPTLRHPVPSGPTGLRDALGALPGAPQAVQRFVDELVATADALGPLVQNPERLPPFGPRALAWHAARLGRYRPLLRQVGRPLAHVLRRHGLDGIAGVRHILEPLCWVTVGVGVDEAEAPFAAAALDAVTRAPHHLPHGMGSLADALVGVIEGTGGEVRLATRVREVQPHAGGYRVRTRRGDLWAPLVLANVLPQALGSLAPALAVPRRWTRQVEAGWGAAMWYLEVDGDGLPEQAFHLDLCNDPSAPYLDGNHVFVSVDGQAEGGRGVVASTHVPLPASGANMAAVHERMRHTLTTLAPELREPRVAFTASPRTFARFTGRPSGWVGGVPRRAGLSAYASLLSVGRVAPGFHLVGDTHLLGQSTLAATLSGVRIAAHASGTSMAAWRATRETPAPRVETAAVRKPQPWA